MPEITKDNEHRTTNTARIVWLLFALLIIFVYFFALGIPLLGPDEPRYAQVAREMYERGDWITPTLGGFNWFEKPALVYWLQIISYKLFGVSEYAARFGSALFGLGTILSLWILGKTVQSSKFEVNSSIEETEISSNFANWLALIAASSIGLTAFSRGASFDIILTFPITASLVGFFVSDRLENKSSFTFYFCLCAFYFFIGIALLAKGLVGIVFPFGIVAFYFLLSRKFPSKQFIFSLFWGTILSLAIAAIWYVPMYQIHGWTFINEFIIQQHFARYTSNKYLHPQPFWFFWIVLPLMTIPWLPFFLAAIYSKLKLQISKLKAQSSEALNTQHSALSTFAVAWLLVPLVFFTFSGSKLPGYILPALPAALILTARYVSRFAEKSKKRARFLQSLAFATFVAVVVLLQFFVVPYAQSETVKSLIEIADAQGYTTEKVLNLHTISHNAEFYAAGRLLRESDGKLKKFLGVAEVAEEIKREGGKNVLVLVPLEYLHQLPESDLVESKILGDNGELAIVLVKGK